jgi:ribose transport system substrate-binding protein
MQTKTRRSLLLAAAAASLAFTATGAAAEPVNLGVSIPAATHSFMGGINYWANQAKKDLEAKHKDLKITIRTAANATEQANQLQDLSTVNRINALVVFPFESAALTRPVANVKAKGAYVTVVDRGLTDTAAQDAYVAGDNTAMSWRCAASRPRSTPSAWMPSTRCSRPIRTSSCSTRNSPIGTGTTPIR